MPLRKSLLPTFSGVGASQMATCDLRLGERVHVIWLKLGDNGGASNGNANAVNTTLDALINEIRIKVNSKVQRTFTPSELNKINSINGSAYAVKTYGTAGQAAYRLHLPIYFGEPWRKDNSQVGAMAWNLAGIESCQIEVDFKAVTSPVISGYYEWEPATGSLGVISKWFKQSFTASGLSNDFNNIEKKEFLQAIHLFPTVEATPRYVNKIKATVNGVIVQDLLDTWENQATLLGRELYPDTSAAPRFDWILDYDDPINGALPLAGTRSFELQVQYNDTAAGNMPVTIIRAGPPE